MEHILHEIIEYTNLIILVIAFVIILIGIINSVAALFRDMKKTPGIYIGESLDLALRYLMVSEVLHTFTSETLEAIINLGLLLLVRIAIVIFNQKEMDHEKAHIEGLVDLIEDKKPTKDITV